MHIIWHGRPTCGVVEDAIVLLPRRPVSLKIGPQIQIQLPPHLPPPMPLFKVGICDDLKASFQGRLILKDGTNALTGTHSAPPHSLATPTKWHLGERPHPLHPEQHGYWVGT